MLKLWIGHNDKSLGTPRAFFMYKFDMSYLETDFSKEVVRSIDKSEVVSRNLIQSEVLGAIPPSMLSNGVKTLLVSKYYSDSVMVNFATMGENCLPYFFRVAMEKDVVACMDCFYIPYNFGYVGGIKILNDGSVVTNDSEFLDKWEEFEEERNFEE